MEMGFWAILITLIGVIGVIGRFRGVWGSFRIRPPIVPPAAYLRRRGQALHHVVLVERPPARVGAGDEGQPVIRLSDHLRRHGEEGLVVRERGLREVATGADLALAEPFPVRE